MSLVSHENLSLTFPAAPESVPAARRELTLFAAQAGASSDQIEAIRLASSEALTNVVVHAYGSAGGRIHVSANLAAEELWVLIGDDGSGLRANHRSQGLGVGLALIAQATDGLTIVNRASGGTEVRMRFSLECAIVGANSQSRGSRRAASWPDSSLFSTTR